MRSQDCASSAPRGLGPKSKYATVQASPVTTLQKAAQISAKSISAPGQVMPREQDWSHKNSASSLLEPEGL